MGNWTITEQTSDWRAEVPYQEEPEAPPEPMSQNGIPMRVLVAIDFVSLCNKHTGYRGFQNVSAAGELLTDVRTQNLNPRQTAALMSACNMLGRYFDGRPLSIEGDTVSPELGGESHNG